MKTKFLLTFAFLLCMAIISSCDKEDDATKLENTKLKGYWVFYKYILFDGVIEADYDISGDYYHFESDNKMYYSFGGAGGQATYYARGEALAIDFPESAGGKKSFKFKIEENVDGQYTNILKLESISSLDDDGITGYLLVRHPYVGR